MRCTEFLAPTVSRIAHGHPNTLKFEVFCEKGAVAFDVSRAGEFQVASNAAPGFR